MNAGRFEDAVQLCKDRGRIELARTAPCGSRLIIALLYSGDAPSALEQLERVTPSRVYTRLAPMVYHGVGDTSAYHQALNTLQAAFAEGDTGLGVWIIIAYAFAGDSESMYRWAEQMARDGTLSLTPNTAYFAAYREERRWQRLLARLGLDNSTLTAIPLEVPALL